MPIWPGVPVAADARVVWLPWLRSEENKKTPPQERAEAHHHAQKLGPLKKWQRKWFFFFRAILPKQGAYHFCQND